MKKGLVTIILSAFSAIASAAPVTGNDAKVALCLTPSGETQIVFNPLTQYNNPIQYMRSNEQLIVIINGIGYSLDVDAAVEEAMAEWTAAIPSLSFQSVPLTLENRNTWRILVNKQNGTGMGLGAGLRSGVMPPLVNPVIMFFREGFTDEGANFDSYAKYLESATMDDYLKFILRVTAKHEIGHLLGFEHTPHGRHTGRKHTTACPVQVIYEAVTNVVPGPPIMARNLHATLRLMYGHFGRPLRLADIQIAPQKAAVARAAFEQNCPVPGHGELRAVKTLGLCSFTSRMIFPDMAPVYQLLMQ